MGKAPKDGRLRDGLYKRADSWCIDITINGKRVRKSFGPNRKEAELALAEIRKQRALARVSNDWSGTEKFFEAKCRITFSEAAQNYLNERTHLKISTLYTYKEYLDNYLLPAFGAIRLSDIKEEQIAKFKSDLAHKLSPRRANSIIGLMRYILSTSHRRGHIEKNPALGVDRLPEPPADINPLSQEELDKVLAVISPAYRDIFVCLAWTGARPGELKALRWRDIKFETSEIQISKARYRNNETTTPKTKSSTRTIPMFPPVREALEGLRNSQKVLQLDGYVFVNTIGKPISRDLSPIWAEALKKAKIKHRPSYQLRHTFASLSLAANAAPALISTILGHDNIQTTFRHYARFIPDNGRQVQRLSDTLFKKEEQSPQIFPQPNQKSK